MLSAVLQDLAQLVLTEAGESAKRRSKKVIKPQDLHAAFKAVPELTKLL
jgi:predicted ATP-dependent protease